MHQEVINTIEDSLDMAVELIIEYYSLQTESPNQSRRIVEQCKKLIDYFTF